MILLNSIWLFALAALSIPVAIHLWNIRPGKTLKVGSIALINESAQKSSRSLKLHDILLFLLRCLLLALVAFVLAIPVWQKYLSSNTVKGRILIPKENLKESYQKFKPEIDSLNKAGYEFHYFNKGFQKADFSKAIADTTKSKSASNVSYWTLAQHLDGQVPSTLPVYLFTPNSASHFNGLKPQVALNLHWKTYVPADSTSTWIENAWLANNNDIIVVQGNSKPGGTSYTNYTVQSGNSRNTPFVVNTDNGRLTVSLKNYSPIAVDTSTWRFAIYADKGTADAGYLKAALGSIIQFTRHKATIKQYADPAQIPAHQDWIFWLSGENVGTELAQKSDNLFVYENGKVKAVNSWIGSNTEGLSANKIALYKSAVAGNNHSTTLWSDGFNDPVLSMDKRGQANIYHFYTHFDPSWNDLVWSDAFPKMLLKLIVDRPSHLNEKQDHRTIDARQLLPAMGNETHAVQGKITERIDLAKYAWLLLIIVFVAERWLSHKKALQKTGRRTLQHG